MSTPTSRPPEFATVTDDDLVTGEAVALDLPPAGLAARMASGLIDVAATLLAGLLMAWFTFAVLISSNADGALAAAASVLLLVTLFLIYPTTVETLTRGKSLGKLALGLRTVRDDAGPISFQHAFVRALVGFVEIYPFTGAPAFFSALLSSRGKRLGDYAAGTYVVRDRVVLRLPHPTQMPPQLAQWAAGADIASLPTGLAIASRQLLGRLHQITPESRSILTADLAEQARAYVAPPPPAGTSPEDFLAAVIASRRDRDHARLVREDQLRRRLTARR